ncbi:hypothetical protein FS749_005116 [Ceratobasidium sp. UAMH 11750]|nr:hypothetical protein FS749_005116 [Ceratobasidium sp. UAMH 11750]
MHNTFWMAWHLVYLCIVPRGVRLIFPRSNFRLPRKLKHTASRRSSISATPYRKCVYNLVVPRIIPCLLFPTTHLSCSPNIQF